MATWTYNDGGRKAAGFKGDADDCVCRAIAIATERPYRDVYNDLNEFSKHERLSRREKLAEAIGRRPRSSARTGVRKSTTREYIESLGWKWTPTMRIGSGCKVHLRDDELPSGRLIVSLSRHIVAVIDGVVQDTSDPSRDGTRCVYGYYQKA